MATFSTRIDRQDAPLPLQIAEELMQNANAIGVVEAILDSNRLQDDSDESFFKNAHQDLFAARRIEDLTRSLSDLQSKIGSQDFEAISEFARNILTQQFQSVQRDSLELKDKVDWQMRVSLSKCEEKLPVIRGRFIASMASYLTTRKPQDLVDARQNQERYHAVNQIRRDYTYTLGGSPDRQDRIEEKAMRLIRLEFYEERVEFALQQLETKIADGAAEGRCGSIYLTDWEKQDINGTIEWIDEQLGYDAVNYWVWKLAGEQPGENWGLVHRYDDLDILKNAILKASQSVVEKMFKEEGAGLDHERILGKCYENLGQPYLDAPIKWMQENISRYPTTLSQAIKEIRTEERGFDKSESSGSSSMVDFSSFEYEQETPQVRPTTITMNELELLANTDQKISDELKQRVEHLIEFLGKHGQLDTINWQVWHLSKASDKSGENWAVVHRYDDLKVLHEALKIAIQRDIDHIVSENFSDPEDQNAFYQEIGRLHSRSHSHLSSSDLVELGRANIVLYLHAVDQTIDALLDRIEQRQQEQEAKADDALYQAIGAAMGKKPEAKPLVGLLELMTEDNIDESSLRKQIQEIIEGPDFDKSLKNQIFLGIWRLAEEPQGNPNFGKENYLDDLDRLHNVLFNILTEIAFE